jgi:hypothetical protein
MMEHPKVATGIPFTLAIFDAKVNAAAAAPAYSSFRRRLLGPPFDQRTPNGSAGKP